MSDVISQDITYHNLTQSGERFLASLSRKTTSLRFDKLRLGTQFMAPGGPDFALTSYASAGCSGRKTTSRDKASASLKLWVSWP